MKPFENLVRFSIFRFLIFEIPKPDLKNYSGKLGSKPIHTVPKKGQKGANNGTKKSI